MEEAVKDLVDGINAQKSRKSEIDADTLCNFGELGLESPRNIVRGFWNAFKQAPGKEE